VVVDHAAGEALVRCVESLERAGADHIVVVDNAVPPGSTRQVLGSGREGRAGVEIVETGLNLGYGPGANRGAAGCGGELLLVCNPDLVLESTALERMKAALVEDPGLAIVGPRVLEPDGTRYPSARRFPSLLEGAGHAIAGVLAPENRFTRRYRMVELSSEKIARVDWVSGSCMLLRRNAFEELGGFDESFFMYGEDVDICWRAHRSGWGVAYVPQASVTHIGGLSTRSRPYRMLAAHHRSTLRFANRSLAGPRRLALPGIAFVLGVRLMAESARIAVAARRRATGAGSADD
jgi:N-acetylglucosaminyl-diphospho-decaprenol L-rhamnosyltransferase